MALIKCPECTHEVSDKALSCPNCGYRINAKKNVIESKFKTSIIITLICIIIIGIIGILFISGSKRNDKKQDFTRADKAAYDMVMEICRRADDPSDIDIISGTVTEMDDGRWTGTLKIKASGRVYNLIIDYENGEYQPSELQDELISYAGDMLTDINFDKNKVQEAINEYWD